MICFVKRRFFCQIPFEGCFESELMHVWRCQHSQLSYGIQNYRNGMRIAVLSCIYLYIFWSFFWMAPTIYRFRIPGALFTEVSDFPNLRKDPVIKRWTCYCCWLWKVIGSHHRPYNLQYSCCIWLTSECSTRFLGSTFPCFPLTDSGWCRCLLGPSRDVVEPWQFV